MDLLIILKNVGALLFGLILAMVYAFFTGKKNERHHQELETAEDIIETNKRKNEYAKTPYATKLKWLRSYDKSK